MFWRHLWSLKASLWQHQTARLRLVFLRVLEVLQCYCTVPCQTSKNAVKFPSLFPSHTQGAHPASVAPRSASSGASFLPLWRLVVLPACKHSIHLRYESLSQMWWLTGELRAGTLPPQGSEVKLDRKRWNTEGLSDLITIQIESTWQSEQNNHPPTLQTFLTHNKNVHNCISTRQYKKNKIKERMFYFPILPADLQTWCSWDPPSPEMSVFSLLRSWTCSN